MQQRLLALPLIAGAAALALSGCATSSASDGGSSDGTIRVVASTNVYGSLVEAIGGDDVSVTSILDDPSQDPHSFESSAKTQLAVSKADLLSSRRTRTIVRPRQIAMYLAKILTPRSLPEIGRRFGGRDHTTVLHAVRKIEELINGDHTLADEIELLKRMIDE